MTSYESVHQLENLHTCEEENYVRKSKRQKSKLIFGLSVCIVILLVLGYCVYNQITRLYRNEEAVSSSIGIQKGERVLLPSSNFLQNNTLSYSKDRRTYQDFQVTQSFIIFVVLLSGRYIGTPVKTSDIPNDKDKTDTHLKKAGYMTSNQKGTLNLKAVDLYAKYDGSNETRGITIQTDGLYNVYARAQLSWLKPKDSPNKLNIIHLVSLHSGAIVKTIANRTITLCTGKTTYSTSTIFIPLHLKQNDRLSMHLSNNLYLYNTIKGNFIGASQF